MRKLSTCLVAGMLVAASMVATRASAQTETVIYNFTGSTTGHNPEANLIISNSGVLYGTTTGNAGTGAGGKAFSLTPPAAPGASWTEAVLFNFSGGLMGRNPVSSLLANPTTGVLYGTTQFGGTGSCAIHETHPHQNLEGCGTVVSLTPPHIHHPKWTEDVLYSFTGRGNGDGYLPYGNLIADSSGALYGTTTTGGGGPYSTGVGVVFKLTPPVGGTGPWSESVLHTFCSTSSPPTYCTDGANPFAGLVADSHGTLYGTTATGGAAGVGTVFSIDPNSGTLTTLYSFTGTAGDGIFPYGPVIFGVDGALYGTTQQGGVNTAECSFGYNGMGGCGTVFKLAPPTGPGGAWTETVLYSFSDTYANGPRDGYWPEGNLIFDQAGDLYGTTLFGGQPCGGDGCGVVFKLTPAGGGTWTESIAHAFAGGPGDGDQPTLAGLVADTSGNLYGTTQLGGSANVGTVFEITP